MSRLAQDDVATDTASVDTILTRADLSSRRSPHRLKNVKPTEQTFYAFYLQEHQNMACRRLHFAGSSFALVGLVTSIRTGSPKPLLTGIAAGYSCAWVGHFFFEKNKPASFNSPLKSFISDFRMYGDILRGNLSLTDTKFDKKG